MTAAYGGSGGPSVGTAADPAAALWASARRRASRSTSIRSGTARSNGCAASAASLPNSTSASVDRSPACCCGACSGSPSSSGTVRFKAAATAAHRSGAIRPPWSHFVAAWGLTPALSANRRCETVRVAIARRSRAGRPSQSIASMSSASKAPSNRGCTVRGHNCTTSVRLWCASA
jgi:hypothetical protein